MPGERLIVQNVTLSSFKFILSSAGLQSAEITFNPNQLYKNTNILVSKADSVKKNYVQTGKN